MAVVSVEMEGELSRGGDNLLYAGMDEGVGSERHRVEASVKLKSELSNSSRTSVKIVESVELLSKVYGNALKGTKAS